MHKIQFLIIFPILAVFLVGCKNSDEVVVTASATEMPVETTISTIMENSSVQTEGYPPPIATLADSYPSPNTEFAYPASPVYDENKRFMIDEPLKPGDNMVTGKGPANVQIKVVSISDVGQPLGSGMIDKDGSFNIDISPPLQANYVVGLMLGDDSMRSEFLDGPGYSDIPMIGLVLTMSVVEPD